MVNKQQKQSTRWTAAAVTGLVSGIARAVTAWLLDRL